MVQLKFHSAAYETNLIKPSHASRKSDFRLIGPILMLFFSMRDRSASTGRLSARAQPPLGGISIRLAVLCIGVSFCVISTRCGSSLRNVAFV